MALSFTAYKCSNRSAKHFLTRDSSYDLYAVVTSTNLLHCATNAATAESNSTYQCFAFRCRYILTSVGLHVGARTWCKIFLKELDKSFNCEICKTEFVQMNGYEWDVWNYFPYQVSPFPGRTLIFFERFPVVARLSNSKMQINLSMEHWRNKTERGKQRYWE